jgi:hypothetical protein
MQVVVLYLDIIHDKWSIKLLDVKLRCDAEVFNERMKHLYHSNEFQSSPARLMIL